MPTPPKASADPIDARLVRKLADILTETGLSEIEVEHAVTSADDAGEAQDAGGRVVCDRHKGRTTRNGRWKCERRWQPID